MNDMQLVFYLLGCILVGGIIGMIIAMIIAEIMLLFLKWKGHFRNKMARHYRNKNKKGKQ